MPRRLLSGVVLILGVITIAGINLIDSTPPPVRAEPYRAGMISKTHDISPPSSAPPRASLSTRHPEEGNVRLEQVLNGESQSQQNENSVLFGISDPNLINQTARVQMSQLMAMRAIGISSVRVDANWRWIQPSGPRAFYWSQLDQEVDSIHAAGMSVDLVIDGCPPWAASANAGGDASPQPASSSQYATFAADVAARYAPKGANIFEIWNEPNIVRFWQPAPSPAAYTADLVAAYAAIKAVDPSAFVISGGLAPAASNGIDYGPINFLKAMYADGAKGSFDALGYHPYSFPAVPDTYEPWSAWSQMASTSPSIKGVMASNGDSSKPIWITEFGAPTSGPSNVGVAAQSTALNQAITYARKFNWIGALYIYTWQDTATGPSIDNGFGLLTSDGSPKPAYSAVAATLSK